MRHILSVPARRPKPLVAIRAIERHGALLVYPLLNRSEPASLWSVLHPGVTMRWEWDEGADDRVVHMWHLREELARSRLVVYGKWFRGRAVFFSRELFAAMLSVVRKAPLELSQEACELMRLLEEDSPQSTKALRRESGLSGRVSEHLWSSAMKELWERLLVVGTGEVDDGAFPSLAVGATRWIFEDLWEASEAPATTEQLALLQRQLASTSAFGKHWHKVLGKLTRDGERQAIETSR